MTSPLAHEKVWFKKHVYDEAEKKYFENLAKLLVNNGIPINIHPSPKIPASEQNRVITKSVESRVPENKLTTPVSVPAKLRTPVTVPDNILATPVVSDKKPVTIISDDKQTQAVNNKDKEKRFKVKESKRNKQNKKMVQKKNEENKVSSNNPIMKNTLAGEVAKARQHIQESLECMDGIEALASNPSVEVNKRITHLEQEVSTLKELVNKLFLEIINLTTNQKTSAPAPAAPATKQPAKPQPAQKQKNNDDDDGIDLFGSDSEEEDAEAKRVREQRLADYANRKAKKPVLIAKSNIILDVKPWDDETDMKKMESLVRKIATDGLVWGASKLVPLAYGIHKLQISCVVEDDKVSVDWLQETIQEIEDFVQSVDIAAFNKV